MKKYINTNKPKFCMKTTFIQLSNATELLNKSKVRYLSENLNASKVSNERVTLEALREYAKNGKRK